MTSRRDRLEAENATLISTLAGMNDAVSQELATRMLKCREDKSAGVRGVSAQLLTQCVPGFNINARQ